MKEIIVLSLICIALLFFVKRIQRMKDMEDSKLTVYEHPSTFEKQGIEMVNSEKLPENPISEKEGD